MTCEEVQAHIENIGTAGSESQSGSGVRAHIAACAECTQFVRERQSLYKSFQLIRESAGPVSESLDAAVLAGYRRFLAERKSAPRHVPKAFLSPALRWSAVAAVLLIATAIALYSTRKPAKTMAVPPPAQPASTTVLAKPQMGVAQPPIRPVRRMASAARKHSLPSEGHPATRTVASIPDDFRGLIYCDELSCNGAMDVIRVQLPSSMIARPTSAFRQTSGLVNADVLIGPDGIARGIRIEEREF